MLLNVVWIEANIKRENQKHLKQNEHKNTTHLHQNVLVGAQQSLGKNL